MGKGGLRQKQLVQLLDHLLWRPSCRLAELSCELRLELPRLKHILHPNNNFSAPKQVLMYRSSKSAISLSAHFSGL